jgi:hypothetical protein
MKIQFNQTIKAHLIRSALYVLLLVAVCAIPFALAQTPTPTATATASPTATPTPTPTSTPSGCVFGQGFWKNHPAQWPVNQLQLGNTTYTQDQLLLILHQPVSGNGLVLLAHQLIAAELNIANGAVGSCIQQTIADANALIGDLVVPPVGTGYLSPPDVSALADTLDEYNDGMLCAPSCEECQGASVSNISTRGFVQTGDNVMIGGFIVRGSETKRVIIRAIGPELTQYGVQNVLANPTLELHDSTGALIASNDNWMMTIIGGIITSNQVQEIQASGYAPSDPFESAIIAELPAGKYTAIVRGVNNMMGVALVEVYALDQ